MYRQYKNTSYIIYDDGRCYSLLSNKFLTPKMSTTYPTYNLTINGKKKQIKVHRMVAETFIEQPPNKPIVNHIDGDTHNFHISNLEWVDYKENAQHAINVLHKRNSNQQKISFNENLKNEIWKPINGYWNYSISSCGRVLNTKTNRLLKLYKDKMGYYTVSLWKQNKGTTWRVHILVYKTFVDDNLKSYVINHIDGNKLNNQITNLEKVSYQQNNLHAVYEIKTNKCAKQVQQLDDNKHVLHSYESIKKAERATGIKNIGRACQKHGKAGGYYWSLI